jgi:hypothetical protein
MGEALNKYYSFLKAAALALALGIGANGAIFSLDRLNRSAEIYPDPIKLLFQSDIQSREADSSRSETSACEYEHGKALEPDALDSHRFFARKQN